MGRPATNVFLAYRRKRGSVRGGHKPHLPARRALYLGMHRNWANNPLYSERLYSVRMRRDGNPDWELYRAAEMAMAMIGRKRPEKADDRSHMLKNFLAFDREAIAFLRWIRNEVAINLSRKPGQKPNAEAIYKTALSALVARNIVQPFGGNWRVLPTTKEIAQVWYVLFEETESPDAIRSRLKSTGKYCRLFERDWVPLIQPKIPRYFGKLGRALLKKYG